MKITWNADLTRAVVIRRCWPWFWIRESTEVEYQKGYFADEAMTDLRSCEYILSNGVKAGLFSTKDSYDISWSELDDSRRDEKRARGPKHVPPANPWKRIERTLGDRILPEARMLARENK